MRTLLRRILGAPSPSKPDSGQLDTQAARRVALDWAILNVHICTRRERERPPESAHSLLGDYLEFGVYRGDSFLHAHHHARRLMPWMRFFAFDSFAGLPAPTGIDQGGEFDQGQFACSRAEFTRILGESGADMSRVHIVEGWYDDVLDDELKQQHDLDICAIAYIDCDLYRSAVPVLEFLTSLVRPGTILLFDDWYCFKADPDRGVQRATREWLGANPHIVLERWHPFCHHGQSFIVQIHHGGQDEASRP